MLQQERSSALDSQLAPLDSHLVFRIHMHFIMLAHWMFSCFLFRYFFPFLKVKVLCFMFSPSGEKIVCCHFFYFFELLLCGMLLLYFNFKKLYYVLSLITIYWFAISCSTRIRWRVYGGVHLLYKYSICYKYSIVKENLKKCEGFEFGNNLIYFG